ncbi:DUF397 domain-containing protein [Kitasatospora sp. NPDC059408]|uniref:DUF397 domain-containing protein n=1 Tax=Kitasatospora sp. NPDC059408 TaxID=3346823 RepID=UPI00367779A9
MIDHFQTVVWRKSTYSDGDGDCIEVADSITGAIPVRDSKDPHGPVLNFTADAWRAFVAGVRTDDFPTTP